MRRASLLSVLAGAFAALAALTTSSQASADPVDVSWWTAFQLNGERLSPTALDVAAHGFGSRTLQGRLAPMPSVNLVGGSWSFGMNLGRHWVLPIFGFGYNWAVGSQREQETNFDGSIIHQRPWTTSIVDIGISGLGYRTNERRWTFSATLIPGITAISSGADAAFGNNTYEIEPSRDLFYLRSELSACRRLDPNERICLVVAPNLYQDGLFQGGVLSLRYQVGK